jgi:hypothetical protein
VLASATVVVTAVAARFGFAADFCSAITAMYYAHDRMAGAHTELREAAERQ